LSGPVRSTVRRNGQATQATANEPGTGFVPSGISNAGAVAAMMKRRSITRRVDSAIPHQDMKIRDFQRGIFHISLAMHSRFPL